MYDTGGVIIEIVKKNKTDMHASLHYSTKDSSLAQGQALLKYFLMNVRSRRCTCCFGFQYNRNGEFPILNTEFVPYYNQHQLDRDC